jgi:hypothetical protein
LLDIEEHHHMAALILDQAQAIHNLG